MKTIQLVGHGVDTLILNVRYSDSSFAPIEQELDNKLQEQLDYLQASAHLDENAVVSMPSNRLARDFPIIL